MAVQNDPQLNPSHLSLYLESRNFIFEYSTHNPEYRAEMLERLTKSNQNYVLYPLKSIAYFLVSIAPPNLASFGKPPFTKIHPLLQYFFSKDAYNKLNSIAEGKFHPFSEEEERDLTEFNKLSEEDKDKKLEEKIEKKEKENKSTSSPTKTYSFTPIPLEEQPPVIIKITETDKKPEITPKQTEFKLASPVIPKLNIEGISVPSFVKDIGVWMMIKTANLINRHPKISVPTSVGVIVGLIQYAATGNPVVGWISGLLTAGGVSVATQYLSAPRSEQYILPENQNIDSSGRFLGGGRSFGFNPLGRTGKVLGKGAGKLGARSGAGAAKTVLPLFANPWTWAVIGIIIALLLLFPMINKLASLFNPTEESTTTPVSDQLTIVKTGPKEVPNGSEIPYEITITYTGKGTADIEISDAIPQKTSFISASDGATPDINNIVKWNLSKINPNSPKKLSLIVKPTEDNIWVVNNAEGKIVSSGGRGAGCFDQATIDANKKSPESCQYLNPSIDLFNTSFSDKQLDKYVTSYSSVFINAGIGDEAEFRRRASYIVNTAQSVGLNPVLFLGYWKSESLFSTARRASSLGCAPSGGSKGFESDVNCAMGLSSDGSSRGGSWAAQCASPNNPERGNACAFIKSIRDSHPLIYTTSMTLPISTFDDFAEMYGPRSPILDGPGTVNNNCVSTYNILLEIANALGACNVGDDGITPISGSPTKCSGTPVSFGIQKKFLPLPEENSCSSTVTGACGRPGTCVAPKRIVLHTTFSSKNTEDTFQYFYSGSDNRGVGSHFIIGSGGGSLQLVETLDSTIEVAYAVANYSDHISIEMTYPGIYNSRDEVPVAQYQTTLKLIKDLMSKYKIPLGNLEFDWKSSTDSFSNTATSGVYGHYQLNPSNRTDPGSGLIRDLREDLKK